MSFAKIAKELKEEGNRLFSIGEYRQAESCYTQAIQKSPRDPRLFTNRAMTRIRLEAWDSSVDDCIKAIEIDSGNMKAYFYLAQAQLGLKHPNEALASALTAYEKCLETHDRSTSAASNLVLTAKKEKWAAREKERLRQRNQMLGELEDSLVMNKKREIFELETENLPPKAFAEERDEIERTSKKKIDELRSIFAIADPQNVQKREVPDYLIDGISFAIMHDPVVTRAGNSYDRATLIEHMKRSQTDPLTREPLSLADLRPNLALKQASAEFLASNGWAVDW